MKSHTSVKLTDARSDIAMLGIELIVFYAMAPRHFVGGILQMPSPALSPQSMRANLREQATTF